MSTPTDQPTSLPTLAPAERIGDAEREVAVSALSDHFAAGRLDNAELDVRLESAYRATTRDQLAGLFADLPTPAPFRPSRLSRRRDDGLARTGRRGWPTVRVLPVLPLLLVLAVVAGSGPDRPFSAVLPLLWVWFWVGGARRWRHHRG
jgi:Domain of unknown function (DUF1707)